MSKDIPIIIHHECRNAYAKKCIKAAEKHNKTVIFMGDETNRDFSNHWVNTNDYCTEEWARFLKIFKNMSFYDDGYATKIFKRFFAMKEYLKRHGLKECILIDSDVLTFADYSSVPIFKDCDVTLFIPNEEPKHSDPLSYGNYAWGASAGTSYFTYEALEDIIRFILDIYENHIDLLEKKWEWHKENNYGGGVCEMTLLFLWYLETDYCVINTKQIFEGKQGKYVLDNDIRTVNDRCDFLKFSRKNIEVVEFINNVPYLINKADNERIMTYCLHFGGITKKYMGAYFAHYRFLLNFRLNLRYCYIEGYLLIAKIYIKFFKKFLGKYRKPKHGEAK